MQKKKNLIQVRRKLLQVLFEYFSSSLLHDNFWACHCAPKICIQCKKFVKNNWKNWQKLCNFRRWKCTVYLKAIKVFRKFSNGVAPNGQEKSWNDPFKDFDFIQPYIWNCIYFFSHLTLVIPIRKAERPRLNWSQFS